MRLHAIAAVAVILGGCAQAPSEVKIKLGSNRILAVKDFKTEPATEYSGCNVGGQILYDIVVQPSDFTGLITVKDAQIKIAGWGRQKEDLWIFFIDGKPEGYTVSLYEYTSDNDPREKKEALCRVKSSSDIVLTSLGTPLMAINGVKATIAAGN